MADDLGRIEVKRKQGTEQFHSSEDAYGHTLLDFWRWSSSDLVDNTMRGILAEYIVALALGVSGGVRENWNPYDLQTPECIRVEVKSAAYLQSWAQRELSTISFDTRTTYAWDSTTNVLAAERTRQADVYVFALLKHQEKATLDPLDLDQWDFYVLPTGILNSKLPQQKRISFATLLALEPIKVTFNGIAGAVAMLFPADSTGV